MSSPLAGRIVDHLQVVKPDGPGPFPVVVQMHGCGGVQPLQARYAQAAARAGVAAVIVDSLAPRGIGRTQAHLAVCSGARLRGAERAGDLVAVFRWLEGQPWTDPNRTAAAGWSHGGWAIMEALVADGARGEGDAGLARLSLAVLIYPYAGPLARTAARGWGARRPSVAAVLAGRDAVVGQAAPRRALDRLAADRLDVELLTLPEATHAFDDDRATDPRTRHRPDLEAQAVAFYVAALQRMTGEPSA